MSNNNDNIKVEGPVIGGLTSGIIRYASAAALAITAGAAGVAAATATDLAPAPAVLACQDCPAGEYVPIWPGAEPWIVFDPSPGTPEED